MTSWGKGWRWQRKGRFDKMCMLFGLCSSTPIWANEILKDFYSYSRIHQDGWGLALLRDDCISVEKEPVKACESSYLKYRLGADITEKNLFAHIRYATVGENAYDNCHPFLMADSSGRKWGLMHNGTLFQTEVIKPYLDCRSGSTDSEALFLHFMDRINALEAEKGSAATASERFGVLDEIVVNNSADNKLNLLIWDGEIMYAHTNETETLFVSRSTDAVMICTKPLKTGNWEPFPMMRLTGWRDGKLVFSGTQHDNEFLPEKHYDMNNYSK